MILLKNPHVHR